MSFELENKSEAGTKNNLNTEKLQKPTHTVDAHKDPTFKKAQNVIVISKIETGNSPVMTADVFCSETETFTNVAENIRHIPTSTRHAFLPWGTPARMSAINPFPLNYTDPSSTNETALRPGEIVMKNLITDFTLQAEKKIELVMVESPDKNLSKLLQRGEDQQFDQLLSTLGSMAEHCLPSLLYTLLAWHKRQLSDNEIKYELKRLEKNAAAKLNADVDVQLQRRESAVEFIFCLALIEILKQLPFHPGHEDIIKNIENLAFKHFKYRDGLQNNPNAHNIHMIADLYAEVIGVLAQSRFACVRKRFMLELKELRAKEPTPFNTQCIISLLMGMKFFRVKMVPIEEFEASFQFMHECGQYFLEVRDKDIKHALAGLFVEILVPVAAVRDQESKEKVKIRKKFIQERSRAETELLVDMPNQQSGNTNDGNTTRRFFRERTAAIKEAVKNEVNVPCVKNFVELLYVQTLDASTKSKHRLALFPLVTCLLCVSQKAFFLANWHYFLAMCLSNLKNRDSKMSRVALESLYRLLWVYMIRIKCESNSATHSRLQSIVNSLFPKGSKVVVPRDTPLNIFVKIIQFIAQERLDFAMREIVYDLLCVGRPIKVILNPERMSIGLRAFLVVADSLQQKDGEPPMPRTVGVLPSGNTLRVKKTYINKMLTDDTARSIGMSAYFPHVRRVFVDILRALDVHYGRPLMMTNTHNQNKEPDEMLTGERKPRIDLFRTCVAAVPRLIPDTMTSQELVDLLSRLTVHMDEELRMLTYQSLQTLVIDFPGWRQDVIHGYTQFLIRDVADTYPQLLENCSRMLFVFLNIWRCAISNLNSSAVVNNVKIQNSIHILNPVNGKETINSNTSSISHQKTCEVNTISSGGSTITSSGISSITQATVLNLAENTKKNEVPLITTLHFVEGFALVLLCYCRPLLRKIAAMILKEVKNLVRVLHLQETEPPLIDVLDRSLPKILETILPQFSQAEKAAIVNANVIDLQWISERTSGVWFTGYSDDSSKSSTLTSNASQSSSPQQQFDPWTFCLKGFMDRQCVIQQCPSVALQAWSICYVRVTNLYNTIDPTPISDNRASLLRSSAPTKKLQTEGYKDLYFRLWRNQIFLAMRLIPQIPALAVRCVSPDLSLSSSPDSLNADRSDKSSIGLASPQALYKLVVPLLRCELIEVKDAVVNALGAINHEALKDLMEELVIYIREAIDRKQENVRRRRRRDALRLQLTRVFEIIAENGTFGASSFVLDRETMSLHPSFIEFIEGARLYLESELDKENISIKEVKLHFCNFIRKMIKNFTLEARITLLSRDLKKNLFNLFATWSGPFAKPLGLSAQTSTLTDDEKLQHSALQAMSGLLCCGPIFHPAYIADDGIIYKWMDSLLVSKDEKIYQLARDTVILLLDSNPDVGLLLEWVIDRCYTSPPKEADACFLSLSTIFSLREYPCDHYTSVINVTLLMTGCPRVEIHSTALQLLQILDKRFFGSIAPIHSDQDYEKVGTLDVLLSNTYCHSQRFLATQIAQLRPELTMSMFSEITHRFQTAREEVRALLLQCLLPWLQNMELIATTVPPATPLSYIMYFPDSGTQGRREGTGSTEATEMILNNLFYITVKFSDIHPRDIEELWGTLCQFWPNNLKVILRYLVIMSGMAPSNLLPYAKRVALYLARTCADRLLDELMLELQTVETLNCLIERTETPPFYRLTHMRKASSHSDGQVAGLSESRIQDIAVEKGTIHTKRHSGEDQIKIGVNKLDASIRGLNSIQNPRAVKEKDKIRPSPSTLPSSEDTLINDTELQPDENVELHVEASTAPLPMPEYGGFFAPLTEFLPDANLPISGFHRCNVAVMLLCDIVVDGIPNIDWTLHLPLLLHILFLGIDHNRAIVRNHCKELCVNLLIVLAEHNDHFAVARILLNNATKKLDVGLPVTSLAVFDKKHKDQELNRCILGSINSQPVLLQQTIYTSELQFNSNFDEQLEISINTSDEIPHHTTPIIQAQIPNIIKSLIQSLSVDNQQPLWNYEDITAKVWTIKSAEQMASFLKDIVRVFADSYPQARIAERWAQTALQLGLSCSSRHYAGRCLQIFRALNVPINSRMLSDILSRLVETVAEQGEDMQGYVTELLLTLEAAVDSLDSDFRPLDVMKDIFKSTPNLNNKENGSNSLSVNKKTFPNALSKSSNFPCQSHARSTSYSLSYCTRKSSNSPNEKQIELRSRNEVERNTTKFGPALLRSRSAQSLKMLGDTAIQEDKMTILSQLFWLSVSLLESDYEHEFLLALRLLSRVLHRLPLDRPDARDKVEKLQQQLKWSGYPGVHALVLKGCTHSATYEPTITLLSQLTPLLNLPVCDPTQSCAFPMNVISVLPYMLLHYEDANDICIRSAENIAQVSSELGTKLENLGTVMTLYSRKTFCKESFQWTKCVVKYLHDTYSHMGLHMLAFLTEVLEKAPTQIHVPVLSIIHSLLHYVDLSGPQAQNINTDLLKTVGKHLDTFNWKESLKILKLIVTRSSSLQIVPPVENSSSNVPMNFCGVSSDSETLSKKELAGRTMEFSFDVSQTPLIGRRIVIKTEEQPSQGSNNSVSVFQQGKNSHGNCSYQSLISTPNSPKRSASLSPADSVPLSGWKRPWMSQSRVRECLINLLTACGQRVGLPKSPSVIFSQSSDLMERQSSVASSTEETSGPQGDLSSGSRRDDGQPDFTVFKDFDFLEYEDSIAGESTDNFNWGVRRHPLFQGDNEVAISKSSVNLDESCSEKTPVLNKRKAQAPEESSDEEIESESAIDDEHRQIFSKSTLHIVPPQSLNLRDRHRRNSVSHSDTSGSSAGDMGDITPCNASPRLPLLIRFSAPIRDEAEECWRKQLHAMLSNQPLTGISDIFLKLHKIIKELNLKSITITKEANKFLSGIGRQLGHQITKFTELLVHKADPPIIWVVNQSASMTQNLLEKLRFNVLEMQEHLETFFDRKDQVMECLDSVKASCKASFFTDVGDQPIADCTVSTHCTQFDSQTAEITLDLGRALYKLLFQLLLLIETNHKIISYIVSDFRHNGQMVDLSQLYMSVRESLILCVNKSEQEPVEITSADCENKPITFQSLATTNSEFESQLFELIDGQKWSDAMYHILKYKSFSNSTANLGIFSNTDNRTSYDDVQIILNMYAQKLLSDQSDAFIISKDSSELDDVYAILSENLYQASKALTSMEMNVKSFSGI